MERQPGYSRGIFDHGCSAAVNTKRLDPANTATVLGIPDDLTPAITWGALADLLGEDGIARDPIRAKYCEDRYQQYVKLARMLPVVIHAELNGQPLIPSTLQEMESSTPQWENTAASVLNPISDILLCSSNLIAFYPVPNQTYSGTFDVVQKTPVPVNSLDDIQIGREQVDMILDYAEHLALFKVGGVEWHDTEHHAQNFFMQSVTYNQRISAAARAALSASWQSERQKSGIPRRKNSAVGLGAMKVTSNA
jgi:hypothetical protein